MDPLGNPNGLAVTVGSSYSVRHLDRWEPVAEFADNWAQTLAKGDGQIQEGRLEWTYFGGSPGRGEALLLEWQPEGGAPVPAGCAGLLPRDFRMGDQWAVGAMHHLAVLPEHRTLGPALSLHRAAQAVARERYSFAFAVPNRKAAAVIKRAGYREIGKMRRYVRILRHEPYIGRLVPFTSVSSPLGALLDGPCTLAGLVRRAFRPDLRLDWPAALDDRIEDLFDEASRSYPILGDRRPAALEARFGLKPNGRFQAAILLDTGSGKIRAYGVIETTDQAASLRDFLARSDEDLGLLLELLAAHLTRRGFPCLTVRFFGASRVIRVLESHGFVCSSLLRKVAEKLGIDAGEEELPILVDGTADSPVWSPVAKRPDSWYLTTAEW